MRNRAIGLSVVGCLAFAALIVGYMWVIPVYRVWEQHKAGEAELAKAEYGKQVAVQEAKAKKEAASLLADAEVERASGVAKANKIIGDSLKENEEYLRYLWVTRSLDMPRKPAKR